ncbi:MAG: Dps family protein [Caulobacteraceae bacterium]
MTVKIDTGLNAEDRGAVAASLVKLLADTYSLYHKTHGYHWNVRGPNFAALHTLLEDQYTEIWGAVDTIAERIRALGELAPQGYTALANLTGIKDGDPEKAWEGMIAELMEDNETVIATARSGFPDAESAGDEATTDLLTERLRAHEKHAWMLRATLGGK